MFITEAYAQTAGVTGSGFAGVAPLILIFAVFYLLLIRPQQKKYKEHKKLVADVKKGDKVLTTGGIIGTIVHVEEDTVNLEIATDTKVQLAKNSIAEVINPKAPNENNPVKVEKKSKCCG